MRLPMIILFTSLCAGTAFGTDIAAAVSMLMTNETALKGVPFRDVVHAATGNRVLPLDVTNQSSQELVAKISRAMDNVLRAMNATNQVAPPTRRINEMSARFETLIRAELNRIDGFHCAIPNTAAGPAQRAGYPDLRLVDAKSGRVVYLDPKLFARHNRSSSLRTFYYEPKRDTNKILEDAHHLIIGFEHEGREESGRWKFLAWELVDLSEFRVQLKAEFQAGNRQLYQQTAIVARGTNNPAEPTQ